MTFIMALLARPAVIAGLVGAIAVGGLALALKIEKGRHASDVARLEQAVLDERALTDLQVKAFDRSQQNVTSCKVDLLDQSAKVRAFELKAKAADAKAAASALEVLRAGERERAALRASEDHRVPGFATLNEAVCKVLNTCAP